MVYIYMSSPPTRSILIYPTVDNNSKFQYIDKAENCFTFEAKEDKCPFNTGSLKKIPIQVWCNNEEWIAKSDGEWFL